MTHNEMTELRITAWMRCFFWCGGMPLVNKQEQVFCIHSNILFRAHTEEKLHQILTCLLPAPLRMRHGPLWLLWDHTSRSSVQLQTPFVNAPTARNKYQQLVLNPLLQVQVSSQLYPLHSAAFAMRLKMSLAPEKNSVSESSTSQSFPGLQKQAPANSHRCSDTELTTLHFLR